jgi:hypothetical protein
MKALPLVAFLLASSSALAAPITPQEAASHIGQIVTVEGVAHVHVARTASFFDMGGAYPNEAFQAVVFPNIAPIFGDLTRYDGKTVDINGRVREYRGKPEIILLSPSQISVK